MGVASMKSGGAPLLETTRGMAWKWILEKVVHCPDFGTTFLKELILHVPDLEDPLCQPLLERVAVRYLEEAVVSNQINGAVIPLIQTLTGCPRSQIPRASSVKERFNRELVLRVKTEARNQSKETLEKYFRKYSLEKLEEDLHNFVDDKKQSFQTPFLDQLVQEFLENKLPSMSVQDLSQGHVLSYRKDNSLFGGATHRFQGLEKTGGTLESLELEKEPEKPSIVRMHQHGKVDTNEELQRQKTGEAQLLQQAGKAPGDLDKSQSQLSEKKESVVLMPSEIASDGHEECCHKCKEGGKLFYCDGCPIAMHGGCLELLGLHLPELQDDWFCPVCTEKTAKDLVSLAEQVAAEAKGKLQLFIRESSKKHCESEGSKLQRLKLDNPGIDNVRPQLSIEEQRVASQGALKVSNQNTNTTNNGRKRQSVAMDENFDYKEDNSSCLYRQWVLS
ncbi:hypothetical protein BDL97_03G115800 [Sphagnum fallax]|nr:hypothetical protein BDL97_03G115800 [Sphagnum fallax]KAH8968170.1 hypothetical protein BDL97_03G115800 [Sphagnum fallax]KAH8968171.1 hypothetical protein BDL97_03G115800 [Sphagnum fallax]